MRQIERASFDPLKNGKFPPTPAQATFKTSVTLHGRARDSDAGKAEYDRSSQGDILHTARRLRM
jgi:hypothetical protein